jgi:hypothetical protein
VTDSTKSVSATITITAPLLANGTYVFSLAGQDAATGYLYNLAGAFTVSSGSIAGGEQDFVDYNANNFYYALTLTDAITGGSVTTTTDGNLQITLTTADTYIGVNGTETLNATLVSASRALITEFDSSASASGTLDLQTSTAALSGGYAFAVGGGDPSGYPVNIGAVINVDGPGTISGAGSVFDADDAGYTAQAQPIDPSTVSAPDSFGRTEISLDLTTSGWGNANYAGYIVDANRIQLLETTTGELYPGVSGGTALAQGANTGAFSTASIAGSSFVFATVGQDYNGYFQVAGVLTTNSDGTTVSGTLNYNDLTGSGAQTPIAFTGTYTVDATGRVTLSNLTDGVTFNVNAQLYLDGNGNGTVVTIDVSDVLAGLAYQQTGGGSFTAASFSGTYGFNATGIGLGSYYEFDAVGPVAADGVGALTGTVDINPLFGTLAPGTALTGDFVADPSGVFVTSTGITGLDVTTPANADAFAYYVIDTTKVVAIETDPNQLTLGYFELQQ